MANLFPEPKNDERDLLKLLFGILHINKVVFSTNWSLNIAHANNKKWQRTTWIVTLIIIFVRPSKCAASDIPRPLAVLRPECFQRVPSGSSTSVLAQLVRSGCPSQCYYSALLWFNEKYSLLSTVPSINCKKKKKTTENKMSIVRQTILFARRRCIK